MKTLLLVFALFFAGCASTLVQTADTQYSINQFDRALLESGGIGMLPVRGVERVSRSVLAAAADSFFFFTPLDIGYTDSKNLARVIASNDLADDYLSFSETIDQTGLVNPKILSALQKLTGQRYYIRIFTDKLDKKTRYGIEKNIITGKNEFVSYDRKSIRVYGQVLDAVSGEIAWEGTGYAGASESRYTYIAQTENQFYAAATETLLRGILGMAPPAEQTLPAQYARVVEKGEQLPNFQYEHRGVFFNVTKCDGICHTVVAYEPVELAENAYAKVLLFWGLHETIDSKFAKKSAENRIDKYLDRYAKNDASDQIAEPEPETPNIEDIPCLNPEKNIDPGHVVISYEVPIYSKRRKSSSVLAEVNFGADVVVLSKKGKFVEVCYEDGSGWIEDIHLGKKNR